MKRRAWVSAWGVLAALTAACTADSGGGGQGAYVSNVRGLDRRNLDETVSPCVDFYQYANGGWLARNPIPPDRPSFSVAVEIQERNYEILHRILENAAREAASAEAGSVVQKVGDFYAAAMDEARLAELGIGPLDADLARIDAAGSVEDVMEVVAVFQSRGYGFPFSTSVLNDLQDSDNNIVYVMQGGLGLPEKDYYESDQHAATRAAYVDHVARMLAFMGADEAEARTGAETVMAIETELAEVSLSRLQQRDLSNYYRIVTLAQADDETPAFSMAAHFDALALDVETVSFPHARFFERLNEMLTERPLDDWKVYLRWHVMNVASPYLSPEVERADFDFYRGVLSGIEEMEPRWKRALQRTDAYLGEALGQLYVAEAFPPETKARADEMIVNLRASLDERISRLEWMSPGTKERAHAKLASFRAKIGYPDEWRDYSSFDVVAGDHYGNVVRGLLFETRRTFDEVGQPPDPDEWGLSPSTVNAYYNIVMNEIVFPAGIMQPPFFDGQTDDAVNYGAMGAIIGHEMGHGFDDQGSRFDEQGNMSNWWSEEDRAEFMRRAQIVVRQYSAYEALEGLFVNGELTLGENIGDIGGLMMAYDALLMALEQHPQEEVDGFSPQQRFFLSFAQTWRGNQRDENTRLQVTTDTHAPRRFRANGPVSNMPEFAEAFGCQPGEPMVRPDSLRVRIW